MTTKKSVGLRMPIKIYDEVLEYAKRHNMSFSDAVLQMLSGFMEKEKKPQFNDHFYNSISVVTEIMYAAFFHNLSEEEKKEIIEKAKKRTEKIRR